MRIALAIIALGGTARADVRVDVGMRGAGSVELTAADRDAVVPAMALRVQHRFGPIWLGGSAAAGFPAYYGQHDLTASLDVEHVLRAPTCDRPVALGDCKGRIAIDAGLDAGIAMLFYDAPPDLPPMSDAVTYWGPVIRTRAQLHVAWPTPAGRTIGMVAGFGVAATRAYYLSNAGTGVRLEPSVEIGIEVGL